MKRSIAVALAAVLSAGPAQAQLFPLEPLTAPDPVVAELVVKPAAPGPAWWRVVDDDSVVYILIVPQAAPTTLAWDRSGVELRLTGANRLITPWDLSLIDPRSIVGIGAIAVQAPFLIAKAKRQQPKPNATPLETRLPPDVSARFTEARTQIGQPADRYAALSPMQATSIEDDYRRWLGLRAGDDMGGPIQKQIEALARSKKVRIEPAWKVTIPAARAKVETHGETTGPKAAQCLDEALTRMTAKAQSELAAARAWADGDVRPLLRPLRFAPDAGCVTAGGTLSFVPGSTAMAKMEEEFVRSELAAVERAMKQPGYTVAILPALSPLGHAEMGLLGTRGLLARLKAKGYEIRSPASAEGR